MKRKANILSCSKNNLISIQILRCLAAVLIVLWHSHLAIKLFKGAYWRGGDAIYRAEHYPFWANHICVGVDIFFCISGFVMCLLATRACGNPKNESFNFFIKRVIRIIPPYWFFTCTVIFIYLVSPQYNLGNLSPNILLDIKRMFYSFMLIPQKDTLILGVGWTLIHELQFYIIVAILIYFGQGKRLPLFMAIISALGLLFYLSGINMFFGYNFSLYDLEFLTGTLIFTFHNKLCSLFPIFQVVISFIIYLAIAAISDDYPTIDQPSMWNIIGYSFIGFFLLNGFLGLDRRYNLSRFKALRIMARIGDASYTLYLSHWFVLSSLGKFASFYPDAPFGIIILWHGMAVGAAILFALFFSGCIELPFHRKLLHHFGDAFMREPKIVVA